jgi:hypothetical protein
VAKLLQRVGQRQIFDDVVIGERVTLESFNGKEQTRKPFFNPPTWRANVVVVLTWVLSEAPF